MHFWAIKYAVPRNPHSLAVIEEKLFLECSVETNAKAWWKKGSEVRFAEVQEQRCGLIDECGLLQVWACLEKDLKSAKCSIDDRENSPFRHIPEITSDTDIFQCGEPEFTAK